jgi:signal transduction histidine kinase
VENFLTYAHPIEATLSEYSIKTLLIETITQVRREFPNHHIQINGDASVPVHSNKIRHAFFNLLKNACEASIENTPIIVTITTKTDWILISIKNQGEPIAADIQAQIFDIFFSTKSAGVGLGLSITKSVIEQHGGTIRLDHSDSNGTEFVIQLPAGNDGKK